MCSYGNDCLRTKRILRRKWFLIFSVNIIRLKGNGCCGAEKSVRYGFVCFHAQIIRKYGNYCLQANRYHLAMLAIIFEQKNMCLGFR